MQYISPVDALLDPTHLKSRPPPSGIATSLDVKCALATRDALVISHLHLVPSIAFLVKPKLPPSVDMEDLIQAGIVALISAAAKFNPGGSPFWAYAKHRVRGAMMESGRRRELREASNEPLDVEAFAYRSPAIDIDAAIDQERLVEALRAAIARLPTHQQAALASTYRDKRRRTRRSRETIRRTLREHGAAIEELRRRLG